MAAPSFSDHSGQTKPNKGSNPCRKVRVVAKIRALTDTEIESSKGVSTTPWISVHKPNDESLNSVAISFGDQSTSRRETYEVDYCYEQHEDNYLIFSSEIKHLISGVLNGRNASVIAFGGRGSGKTHTIQGSDDKPGLAVLAMAEILSRAEDVGKSVTISFFEVYQDHVYDVLDPKRPAVLILEDAQGKIQLKGLSQVSVKSISEFQKLYFNGCSSHKPTQKVGLELAKRRSHKGLMVHVSSCNDKLNTQLVGKMNFLDLAGYEDARRKSTDGSNIVENTRINKSLYALQNVVCALNANESHVPYRESKLTRMLQGSLGGTNQILMIACFNPYFCQDTIYMASLASRACQGINRVSADSSNSARPRVASSKFMKHSSVSTSVKKQTGSRLPLPEKKPNGVALAMKGRKLFDEANHLKSLEQDSMQAKSSSDFASAIIPYQQKVEKSTSDISEAMVPLEEEISSSIAMKDTILTFIVKKGTSPLAAPNALEPPTEIKHSEDNHSEVTPSNNSSTKALTFREEGSYIDKENKSSLVNEDGSPPISARLRELSNNLKSLYSSTPLCVKMPGENDISLNGEVCADIVEPKTPVVERNLRVNDKLEVANISSPWETFSTRSCGMKKSLVQEYLQFLNTANKEELKGLKGIGEKRATYILELREESPEPFKNLDDLKDIGLSAKQIKGMMKKVAGELFS